MFEDIRNAVQKNFKELSKETLQKAFLQNLLVQKETQKLEGLSIEEIQKQIDQLA